MLQYDCYPILIEMKFTGVIFVLIAFSLDCGDSSQSSSAKDEPICIVQVSVESTSQFTVNQDIQFQGTYVTNGYEGCLKATCNKGVTKYTRYEIFL